MQRLGVYSKTGREHESRADPGQRPRRAGAAAASAVRAFFPAELLPMSAQAEQ
jgi:hypothetical protein